MAVDKIARMQNAHNTSELLQIAAQLDTATTLAHTQTESVKSLPTGTLDGVVDGLEMNGLSLVNSVVNGDFADGTTGWAAINSTHMVASNVLSNTSAATQFPYSSCNCLVVGDQYFTYVKARVTNAVCTAIKIWVGTSQGIEVLSPVQNQWYELYGIKNAGSNGRLEINHRYADAIAGRVMEVDGNAGVFAINMTALGIEDYTEAQMLDLVRGGYFDGLKGVENAIITTKNADESKSSHLTITTTLRSLPNGVHDRVYEADGQVWLEKNVEEASIATGTVLNTTNLSGAKTSGSFIAVQTDNAMLTGVVDGTVTLTANATVQYELATPTLTNLTAAGTATGELMAFENGTVYLDADAFHVPSASFDVPTNTGAVIQSLVESANAQAKAIESKASKEQEDWIEPTLLNGWVNETGDLENPVAYFKDALGVVHLKGRCKNGTASIYTPIFALPVGYRPVGSTTFCLVSGDTPRAAYYQDGFIRILGSVSSSSLCFDNVTFRAEG